MGFQPSWRHLPESDNRTMVAYRGSDVHLSWDHKENKEARRIKPCAYVKEGKGTFVQFSFAFLLCSNS